MVESGQLSPSVTIAVGPTQLRSAAGRRASFDALRSESHSQKTCKHRNQLWKGLGYQFYCIDPPFWRLLALLQRAWSYPRGMWPTLVGAPMKLVPGRVTKLIGCSASQLGTCCPTFVAGKSPSKFHCGPDQPDHRSAKPNRTEPVLARSAVRLYTSAFAKWPVTTRHRFLITVTSTTQRHNNASPAHLISRIASVHQLSMVRRWFQSRPHVWLCGAIEVRLWHKLQVEKGKDSTSGFSGLRCFCLDEDNTDTVPGYGAVR